MVSTNTRIAALEKELLRLHEELEKERNRNCPRCESEHYLLIPGQPGIPDVRRCFDCRYPNKNHATGSTFTSHSELLASLPEADKYEITIWTHNVEQVKSGLTEVVAMVTLATLEGKAAYRGPNKGWEIWWVDAAGNRLDDLPDMEP